MITDQHKGFVRAVVALARTHMIGEVRMEFRTSNNCRLQAGGHERITASWSEGRHGDPSSISMETRACQKIDECQEDGPKAGREEAAEMLVGAGKVDREVFKRARDACRTGGGDVLREVSLMSMVPEADLLEVLAREYRMDTIQLAGLHIPPDVVKAISGEVARKYRVVPVMGFEDTLTVAVSDPTDLQTLDVLRYTLKKDIEPVCATLAEINEAIERLYPE